MNHIQVASTLNHLRLLIKHESYQYAIATAMDAFDLDQGEAFELLCWIKEAPEDHLWLLETIN